MDEKMEVTCLIQQGKCNGCEHMIFPEIAHNKGWCFVKIILNIIMMF